MTTERRPNILVRFLARLLRPVVREATRPERETLLQLRCEVLGIDPDSVTLK